MNPTKLALQSAMVFFGTLLAAALVALGEPGHIAVQMAGNNASSGEVVASILGLDD
ncbi:MAG TPA: hypothetical protein VHL79_24260 [Ramlibacter sp.]|jgi:hypothetical protein|nr:hypothetical protein [Ramlibacter sp.]